MDHISHSDFHSIEQTPEQTSSSQEPPHAQGSSEGHQVTIASSEIAPLRKSTSWASSITDGNYCEPEKTTSEIIPSLLDATQKQKALEEKAPRQLAATNATRTSLDQEFENDQKPYAHSEQDDDNEIIYTPVGSFKPKKQDIGNVEYHGDGSYTIIDMNGRRFHYPINGGPSSENSSCIVS